MLAKASTQCLRVITRTPRCRYHSSAAREEPLELAFELHDPPKGAEVDTRHGPILFLHGLFGSKQNNRSISKVLARDLSRPVYNIDLRNHGASPHSPTHTYEAMALDVKHFLHRHSLSNTAIIGHSMGAKVAMTLCLDSAASDSRTPSSSSSASSRQSQDDKALVTSLISIDNAPLDAALSSDFGKYVTGMRAIASHNPPVQSQAEADAILAPYAPELPVRQFLLTNLVRNTSSTSSGPPPSDQGVAAEAKYKFRIPIPTLSKAVGLGLLADFPYKRPGDVRWEGRALFIRGNKSTYIPDEALPVIGAFFPRFELLDIDAGHWVVSEKPEETRRGMVEFLRGES